MTIHRDDDSLRWQDARSAHDSASPTEDALQYHDHDADSSADQPLPRPKRRPRRAKADRGLPPDDELVVLATTYLERQRKFWPELVKAGLLPKPSKDAIRDMVTNFKLRHRTGMVDLVQIRPYTRIVTKLGGNYNRYSCDNSSPTSALDQMVNCLEQARQEDRFIPWAYVFCDYSVTGLDASRQGYSSYKAVLTHDVHLIDTTYIDDFTRASRDEIEWWKLAALSKRLSKRMVGASDGFDMDNPNSDVLITVFGLVSRQFIKGLREKVKRGMRGAAQRGTVLGKLSLGFTRKVHRDKEGNIVRRPDGRPRHEPCIDPQTQEHRVLMYELFSEKHWSPYKIARHFNDLKVDGWDGWTEKGIKQLLVGLDAMGIFIWNRTHREYDPEQDRTVVVNNPRSEWEVYIDRNLRVVPIKWWVYARRKLRNVWDKRSKAAKPTRNQVSATTLFSGTLVCESCGAEIKLIRSAGKYRQMGCLNGTRHAHGCKLSTSKSVQIIEDCLLDFIRVSLLTEAVVADVIQRANVFFEREACTPRIDTAPMKAEVRKLKANIKKYQTFIEEEPDEDLCRSHNNRVKELQARLNDVQEHLRSADRKNRKPPKPLDVERSKRLIPDLRELLNQEVAMAAETVRSLTGPITVRQEEIPGKHGGRWIATFSTDLVVLLQQVARKKGSPDAKSLAALPPDPQTIEVIIDKVSKYERLAPVFKQMRDNGASIQSIASAHGMSWQYASEILRFADTGVRPKWKPGKRTGTGAKPTKYMEIRKEVTYLRDKKKMSIVQIAAKLGVSRATATRAYDHEHQEAVHEAAERGESPCRGQYSHLGEDVYEEIRKLLRAGTKPYEVAAKVGCGASTVYRVQRKMRAEASEDHAA